MQLEHKLKAVPSCTLGALQERSEEHLKHPDRWLLFEQLLFVPKHVTLSEKMRLALLVSFPASCFFDQQGLLIRTWMVIFVDVRTEIGRSKNSHFHFWTLQEDATPHKVTFAYLLEPFSSLLHVWPCRHQLTYFHACRRQICQFQLDPVRSPHLLDIIFVLIHPLNWTSTHHARKRKEPGRMPYWKDKGHVSILIFQGKVWIVTAGTIGGIANIAFQNKKPWIFRIETVKPCKQEAERFDEALRQMTPIRAPFVCSKACDIVGEDAFSVASLHSIGLSDIKWGTFMRQWSTYVTWFVGEIPTCSGENFQLVQTECPESSQQDTDRGSL